MPKRTRVVIGGVATRGRTHHAAVIDQQGRLLGDREFPTFRHVAEALGWGRRRKLHGMQVLTSDRMDSAAGSS